MDKTKLSRPSQAARRVLAIWSLAAIVLGSLPGIAQAIPLFNRQTGQNCLACHAGGQFPELTPYGRMFKMTGYTIGERTLPISAMALVSAAKVADTSKSDDPSSDFQKNGNLTFSTASVFLGGKITDNIGAFAQITYDPYATQSADGTFHGHTNADNIDLRYADRLVDANRDLIFGVSVNNNPSLSDPWNTAAAWMQYVPVPSPTSNQFIDGASPYPSFASGGNIAGVTAYAFWNRSVYAELGAYGTSRGLLSFMSAGIPDDAKTQLRGTNPYWRLAWNHEWGPHSLMIGTSGMNAQIYDDPLATTDPTAVHHTQDRMVDLHYQYLLDPHSVTVQAVYARQHVQYSPFQADQPFTTFVDAAGNALPNTNDSDTFHVFRAKVSYVYEAKYGGSFSLFNLSGTTNTALQSSGFDPTTLTITSDPAATSPSARVSGNLSGSPGSRGWTAEVFMTPIQYVRTGLQYTAYSRYNGASSNYDGFGRNAKDNNTWFFYVWGAY
jgi:hypothetical protein